MSIGIVEIEQEYKYFYRLSWTLYQAKKIQASSALISVRKSNTCVPCLPLLPHFMKSLSRESFNENANEVWMFVVIFSKKWSDLRQRDTFSPVLPQLLSKRLSKDFFIINAWWSWNNQKRIFVLATTTFLKSN